MAMICMHVIKGGDSFFLSTLDILEKVGGHSQMLAHLALYHVWQQLLCTSLFSFIYFFIHLVRMHV